MGIFVVQRLREIMPNQRHNLTMATSQHDRVYLLQPISENGRQHLIQSRGEIK